MKSVTKVSGIVPALSLLVVGLIVMGYIIIKQSRSWVEEYESAINGIVKEVKYIGRDAHMISINLSTGKSTNVSILGSHDIAIGDSICKKAKTKYYLLYKKKHLRYELADSITMRY